MFPVGGFVLAIKGLPNFKAPDLLDFVLMGIYVFFLRKKADNLTKKLHL